MQESMSSIESLLFTYIDKCKFLFFPDQWNNVFLDYSKNEIFALLLIYRRGHVNMTEVADYMSVPLNTATGVIGRLEKKGLVIRERNSFDKRVVTISLTETGREFMIREMTELSGYYQQIMNILTKEERRIALQIIDKVFGVLEQDAGREQDIRHEEKKEKRIIVE